MSIIGLFFLAVGLAMDAFAVAIGIGLNLNKKTRNKALTVGLYFGFFQGAMPLIGYFTANIFAESVSQYSDWIAFALLFIIGAKMVWSSFEKDKPAELSTSPSQMLLLSVATSIDALAVGVSFALVNVNIFLAVLVIGVVTFAISAAGVRIGSIFGEKYKTQAMLAGGVVLIVIGVSVLLN
ncbi:MAG: manganese efflux pump MntP family protein [Defluviitaleaceae bacterium]|nr:manganese efflux pump MntP family protein [Defluviitaleaceae bacterium]